jgi:hypothetical protein
VAGSFIEYGALVNKSTAVLFLDSRSAYYSIIRQFIGAVPSSDDDVAHIVANLGLPQDALHTAHARLQDHNSRRDGP